jgi:hypothetical protein
LPEDWSPIRTEALSAAVAYAKRESTTYLDPEAVLDIARTFESYLRGDSK